MQLALLEIVGRIRDIVVLNESSVRKRLKTTQHSERAFDGHMRK